MGCAISFESMKQISFHSIYANLPERFYQVLKKTEFPKLELLKWNEELSQDLQIDRSSLTDDDLAQIFSGNILFSEQKHVAQAYSGHQFGHFNPHLGDGRALLLGELKDCFGKFRDVHLKGSGPTQFSRRGDGKANLAAVIREYIVSEAMCGLKIPASRTLAIISTGEIIRRDTEQPGAILVRVASSHVRVGTFEYFLSRQDSAGLKILADFVIERHDSDLEKNSLGYVKLFGRIVQRQAELISKWMTVGFIHGVMNTDNTFVSGETLDFGPCAFMEEFDPLAVFSSIDQNGRYAYMRQPEIIQWNLSSLAQCFLHFIDGNKEALREELVSILENFNQVFYDIHLLATAKKFGLVSVSKDDMEPMQSFLKILHSEKLDFTNSFRRLSQQIEPGFNDSLFQSSDMQSWLIQWRARLKEQNQTTTEIQVLMNSVNPAYIARNHRVEEAIRFAVDKNDFTKFEKLVSVLKNPFLDQPENTDYAKAAQPHEVVSETFCNT